jgi:drug/metabolite transporter (DMT)-like permease
VFWRSLSACVSISLLIIWRERSGTVRAVAKMSKPGVAVAVAFACSSISMVVALSRTSVAIVLVIFALSPLAAAVLAWIIIGERVRSYTWVAIGVTVAGVGFMVSGQGAGSSATGALIALTIPLAFGYGTVMIRRNSEVAMAPAMLLAAVIGALVALPFAHPFDVTRHDLLLLLTFGFAQLGIGLAIFSVGAAGAPATEVALLSMLEPIMGPIWVWIFVSEYPGVPALIGGSVVFVALAAHTVYAASRAEIELCRSEPAGHVGSDKVRIEEEYQPSSTGLTVSPGETISSIRPNTSAERETSAASSSETS